MGIKLKLIFGLLFLSLSSAYAGNLTLIQDDRSVKVVSSFGNSTETPPGPFADWSSLHQNSIVSGMSFSGDGDGYGESDFDFFIRDSFFDITFSLATSRAMTLTGQLSGEDGSFGIGEAIVQLIDGTNVFDAKLFQDFGGSGFTNNFNYADILAAGDYRLRVFTNITPGGFDTTAEWSFQADFAAVPVPAAGWLFLSALAGLAGIRCRTSIGA